MPDLMTTDCASAWVSRRTATVAISLALQLLPLRRTDAAEDRVDFKLMWYQEDNDRMKVMTPAVLYQGEFDPTLSIKIQGVYNSISGASPTGAPPISKPRTVAGKTTPAPVVYSQVPYSTQVQEAHENEHENESEGGDRRIGRMLTLPPPSVSRTLYATRAGATPAPAPAPTPAPSTKTTTSSKAKQTTAAPASPSGNDVQIPTATVEDERTAVNLELTKILGDHAFTGGLSYSQESDYKSTGLALQDAISFNQKNTTLLLGTAYTMDKVDSFIRGGVQDKDTIDLLVGLTQVIDANTLFNIDLTLGQVSGYLDDPYKVVELNGKLVPEHRPDSKDKKILYMSISHMFPELEGTLETGYRLYTDSFGSTSHTLMLDWFQKLGGGFILSPSLRYYQQSAVDFYDIRFTGSPEFYSSDYRLSDLRAIGYGLKLIYMPTEKWSIDAGVERYDQQGTDGRTAADMYPSANIVTLGARIWF